MLHTKMWMRHCPAPLPSDQRPQFISNSVLKTEDLRKDRGFQLVNVLRDDGPAKTAVSNQVMSLETVDLRRPRSPTS